MNPEPMNTDSGELAGAELSLEQPVFMGSGLPLRGPRNDIRRG
jgi:hypothetical protein